MDESGLKRRERALEEEFFARQNRKLLEKMRTEQEAAEGRAALAQASGIRDEQVLDRLVQLGIRPETIAALSLVPLVAVAWADGQVAGREREAVLESARASGIQRDDMAYELLEGWLGSKPGKTLLTAWTDYIHALSVSLEGVGKAAIRDEVLGRARRVAEAAGGFLGLGKKVSAEEQAVLDELARAFE